MTNQSKKNWKICYLTLSQKLKPKLPKKSWTNPEFLNVTNHLNLLSIHQNLKLFIIILSVINAMLMIFKELDTNVPSAMIMIYAKNVKLSLIILILSSKSNILNKNLSKLLSSWKIKKILLKLMVKDSKWMVFLNLFNMEWISLNNLAKDSIKIALEDTNRSNKKKLKPKNKKEKLNLQFNKKCLEKLKKRKLRKLKSKKLKFPRSKSLSKSQLRKKKQLAMRAESLKELTICANWRTLDSPRHTNSQVSIL